MWEFDVSDADKASRCEARWQFPLSQFGHGVSGAARRKCQFLSLLNALNFAWAVIPKIAPSECWENLITAWAAYARGDAKAAICLATFGKRIFASEIQRRLRESCVLVTSGVLIELKVLDAFSRSFLADHRNSPTRSSSSAAGCPPWSMSLEYRGYPGCRQSCRRSHCREFVNATIYGFIFDLCSHQHIRTRCCWKPH